MEARGGLSRAGGECRGNSSRYFSSLSVSGGDNTSYLPGKQGGLKGNEVGKQHRVLGASGPEPADDAFFLLSSLGRSKPIHKMPSQPLPHTPCPHPLRRPPTGPVPALSCLQHPLGLHLLTCPSLFRDFSHSLAWLFPISL